MTLVIFIDSFFLFCLLNQFLAVLKLCFHDSDTHHRPHRQGDEYCLQRLSHRRLSGPDGIFESP